MSASKTSHQDPPWFERTPWVWILLGPLRSANTIDDERWAGYLWSAVFFVLLATSLFDPFGWRAIPFWLLGLGNGLFGFALRVRTTRGICALLYRWLGSLGYVLLAVGLTSLLVLSAEVLIAGV